MKFRRPKRFSGASLEDVVRFLRGDLANVLADWAMGFTRFTFTDNTEQFRATVTVVAGDVVAIPNKLKTPKIIWFPIRIRGDANLIEDAQGITEDQIFLTNSGANDLTATVLFLKE